MATRIYAATAINGGSTGAMDSLVYATLNDGDICLVTNSSENWAVFRFESSSATAESSPWTTNKVVAPDDVGANNGRWVLCDQLSDDMTVYGDLTVSGTYTPSGLTLTADIDLGDACNISLTDTQPASDHKTTGLIMTFTAGENLVFGDFVYFKSDGKLWKADADASTTMPCVGMAAATILADASGDILFDGVARDDTWAWTVGGVVYGSTTAGAATQTAPSGSGDIVQIYGIATHADRMLVRPSLTFVEIA